MNSYKMGFYFGIFVIVAVFLIAVLVKKAKKCNENYDERQILIRGKGYKLSFITMVILNLIYSCFFYGLTKDTVSPQFVIIAIAYIGIIVYTLYCIFNDAYLQIGQNYKKWELVLIFVAAANGFAAFASNEKTFFADGYATSFSTNLLFAISFVIILISMFVKQFLDKRGDVNEES